MDLLMNETIKMFGQLDVLVNNAGILVYYDIDTYTGEDFDKIFSVNVKAPTYLTKLAKPHLSKTKGNIVNMCSMVREWYVKPLLLYGMTKASTAYLTKSTAADFAENGIRCNAVCPAVIAETEIFNGIVSEEIQQFYYKDGVTKLHGRVTTKSEVSDLIRFLASDKATMITGELITIDGGKMVLMTS
uniref:Uncharacterized oxidoreductase TM_0325-like n=1 Tax=Ciona intestinalis TaxID=7719 RepID=F6U428_CIOIN|nr:uncharacterized protein LOC100176708 [Ciona intestinalis]|eukprot:XP_002127640.1 uncharacterized protein LOC100176708 [Ciona intestinalis]